MTNPGVGDLPNEDLQAVGCPLLSRPCCGWSLGSIHPLRSWWVIPTSTWELSGSAYFWLADLVPSHLVISKAPWILRAASGRRHQARGLGWFLGWMVADWMPNFNAARSSEAVRTRLHFQGVSETWDFTYHWIVLFLLGNPLHQSFSKLKTHPDRIGVHRAAFAVKDCPEGVDEARTAGWRRQWIR